MLILVWNISVYIFQNMLFRIILNCKVFSLFSLLKTCDDVDYDDDDDDNDNWQEKLIVCTK